MDGELSHKDVRFIVGQGKCVAWDRVGRQK